ncbi:MAG: mechanosensitive ion channel family protein [Myxococcota bacterium]|nr:mechanosensitive ion channel family protein [Myxococcota bacterium]
MSWPHPSRLSRVIHALVLALWIALGMAVGIGASAAAQEAAPPAPEAPPAEAVATPAGPPAALASPRATMTTFLEAMTALQLNPGAWDDAIACLDLSTVGPEVARERARQLYAALNRIEEVDVETLPDAGEIVRRDLDRYRFFPDRRAHRDVLRRIGSPRGEIVFEPGEDGAWRVNAASVATLPDLAAQLEPLPLVAGSEILTFGDWVQSKLPRSFVEGQLLGVRYWQWVALFGLILLGLVVDLVVRGVLRAASVRLVDPEDAPELRRTLRPVGFVAAVAVWLLALGFLDLEGLAVQILTGALQIFLVLVATQAAWRLIDLAASVLARQAERTATKLDDVLVPLVTRGVKIFVVVMGVIYGADALDIPIAPLLASLTVAGVGFSFAAKDTVENFFGSIAVLLDRPFDIGDWVVIDDTEGVVEQVGFRSTRIRTFYNSQITVPNSNLVRATVDNYGRRSYRRWKTTVGLTYDTSPEKLLAFTEGVRELVRNHPYTRKDYYQVWCNDFGAASLDVLIYVFFEVPDWSTELRERERLFVDMLRLADRLGVEFAFPTQTLHVYPGQAAQSAVHALPRGVTESGAHREGQRAAQQIVRDQGWRSRAPGPVVLPDAPLNGVLDAAGNPIEPDEPTPDPNADRGGEGG